MTRPGWETEAPLNALRPETEEESMLCMLMEFRQVKDPILSKEGKYQSVSAMLSTSFCKISGC